VIAEVDENTDLYEEGHIPGAVKLHWREDLQDPSATSSTSSGASRESQSQGHDDTPHAIGCTNPKRSQRPGTLVGSISRA
jgi:thiosulfate/3-mercaptopyruvate sulfurtransferase